MELLNRQGCRPLPIHCIIPIPVPSAKYQCEHASRGRTNQKNLLSRSRLAVLSLFATKQYDCIADDLTILMKTVKKDV